MDGRRKSVLLSVEFAKGTANVLDRKERMKSGLFQKHRKFEIVESEVELLLARLLARLCPRLFRGAVLRG